MKEDSKDLPWEVKPWATPAICPAPEMTGEDKAWRRPSGGRKFLSSIVRQEKGGAIPALRHILPGLDRPGDPATKRAGPHGDPARDNSR
jgi:hypothetical protein